jgi:hypothetical protein
MTKKKSRDEPWQAKLGVRGLNPLAVQDLQEAVQHKKSLATLDGVKFEIKYIDDDTIFYSPVDGFAPCGYLKIDRLLEG